MGIATPLSDAVAVVTGAGSGIGRACALEFAARGACVVVSDLDEQRAHETLELVGASGGRGASRRVDVTSEDDLVALRELALSRFGRVDVVMNNVGIITMGSPETMPMDAWQRSLDVNLLSIARSNLVFLPLLVAQGHGHVVNTASASGLLAYGFDRVPYVASKHAVVGVTEALAIHLGPLGVGVTCLCPSGVATNIREQITSYGTSSSPRAPRHPVVTADVVGRLVADAVESGTFLVVTTDLVHEELRERANDIEGYIDRMIEAQRREREG